MSEVGRQQLDIAKQHAATVTATLNAVNAYAEWAPLQDLAKYGIIYGYVYLEAALKSFVGFISHFPIPFLSAQLWCHAVFS